MTVSTANGLIAKRYMDAGELVPDNVMLRMFALELSQLSKSSWLLDGKWHMFP